MHYAYTCQEENTHDADKSGRHAGRIGASSDSGHGLIREKGLGSPQQPIG